MCRGRIHRSQKGALDLGVFAQGRDWNLWAAVQLSAHPRDQRRKRDLARPRDILPARARTVSLQCRRSSSTPATIRCLFARPCLRAWPPVWVSSLLEASGLVRGAGEVGRLLWRAFDRKSRGGIARFGADGSWSLKLFAQLREFGREWAQQAIAS